MPDIRIRGVNAETINRLKARARRHGRSFQAEVKLALRQAAGGGHRDIGKIIDAWQKKMSGRKMPSSVELIRQDRRR